MEDFVYNGTAMGSVANILMANNFDPNVMRPYIGADGRHYFTTVNSKGVAVPQIRHNADATLRYDEWKQIDQAVIQAAQSRLRAVADLRGAGLQYVIPNGMGKTVLMSESQSDISGASVTMDGMEKSAGDRPEYGSVNLPLPIIHKDFSFSLRQISTSRQGGSPLDTTMAALAGRKVAEAAEELTVGSTTLGVNFGGGQIYGYTTYPDAIGFTHTSPEASGWTPALTISEVLQMCKASVTAFHYGPWVLYYGPAWMEKMNDEYKVYSNDTLVTRLKKIENLTDVRMLDTLSGYDLVLVQQTSDVARMVVGMDITTLQWDTEGGMKQNFKVMAILVPQLRSDFNGNTGIVHSTV